MLFFYLDDALIWAVGTIFWCHQCYPMDYIVEFHSNWLVTMIRWTSWWFQAIFCLSNTKCTIINHFDQNLCTKIWWFNLHFSMTPLQMISPPFIVKQEVKQIENSIEILLMFWFSKACSFLSKLTHTNGDGYTVCMWWWRLTVGEIFRTSKIHTVNFTCMLTHTAQLYQRIIRLALTISIKREIVNKRNQTQRNESENCK